MFALSGSESLQMLRLLMLEGDGVAAELTLRALQSAGLPCAAERATSEVEFRAALGLSPDLVLSDSHVAGFDGMAALAIVRSLQPTTPFIFLCSHMDERAIRRALESGASACVPRADLSRLAEVVRALLATGKPARRASDRLERKADAGQSAEHLLQRQEALERVLRQQDASQLSNLLSRTP